MDAVVRYLIVGLIGCGMVLGWLLLLAGDSALQNACPDHCREVTGLTWWIVWFQVVVYGFSLPVQVFASPAIRCSLDASRGLGFLVCAYSWS